jgi:hypothetical protein
MLICIGGLPGSERRAFAQALATHLGFHYYDINGKKRRYPVFTKEGMVVRSSHPKTDEERIMLYEKVLKDFQMLSKLYPDTVVDDVFHRAGPREQFFSRARVFFPDVRVIWIDSDDTGTETRIRTRHGARSRWLLRARAEIQKQFQPFIPAIPVFSNPTLTDATRKDFFDFIRREIFADA